MNKLHVPQCDKLINHVFLAFIEQYLSPSLQKDEVEYK